MDFVLNNTFCFNDRFGADPDSFSGSGESYKVDAVTVWDTNFVPNVRTIPLHLRRNRGAGGSFLHIELAENAMTTHISELPVGTYKKAHRHGRWRPCGHHRRRGLLADVAGGRTDQALRLARRSIIVPPERWFHQHFNTGANAGALPRAALGQPEACPAAREELRHRRKREDRGDQIEYADEAAQIRRLFRAGIGQTRRGLPHGRCPQHSGFLRAFSGKREDEPTACESLHAPCSRAP